MPIRQGGVTHFEIVQPEWSRTQWKGRKHFAARIDLQPVYTNRELVGSLMQRAELQDFAVIAGTRDTPTGEEIVWLRRVESEEKAS
jgi:hypothetical protein